jgi:SAM-dependent methyltransferase
VDYRRSSIEALAASGEAPFDAITCMEMLEHVPDPAAVIAACAGLLKPGGRLFMSTLNRTAAAFALAIVGAEYVARLLRRPVFAVRHNAGERGDLVVEPHRIVKGILVALVLRLVHLLLLPAPTFPFSFPPAFSLLDPTLHA